MDCLKWDNHKVSPPSARDLYRKLPSLDELTRSSALQPMIARDGRDWVVEATRIFLVRLREQIAANQLDEEALDRSLAGAVEAIERQTRQTLEFSLEPVINATGVILHTNLGRAPLSRLALEHLQEITRGYCNLEFELATGERGKRDTHVERLLRSLLNPETLGQPATGGQDNAAIVVNNNAAGLLLALNTLAEHGEVIVSRGELVEIGGSFRIPEILSKSGAILREVGTTNRTRIGDYERAISEKTKLLLRVHRSNFQITGFTEQPALEELVMLARKRSLPLLEDLGSGALFDLREVGVSGEPSWNESLKLGVDVVACSADKLLGGPQAGILSGRREWIDRMRANPLFRALRVDKLTYAALEATLLAYLKRDYDAIPVLAMMRLSQPRILARATEVARRVDCSGLQIALVEGESVIGGGAAPAARLPTWLLSIGSAKCSARDLAARLRAHHPPVVARLEQDRVLLDLRTVSPEQDEIVSQALSLPF
jgi:L-seryl-tRNA(Ser) seleniumtransferase